MDSFHKNFNRFWKIVSDNAHVIKFNGVNLPGDNSAEFSFTDSSGQKHTVRGTIEYGEYSANVVSFLEDLVSKIHNG